MTKDQLISKQQLKIEGLEEQLSEFKEKESRLYNNLFGIGGPLNDSRISYTKEQRAEFFSIRDIFELR